MGIRDAYRDDMAQLRATDREVELLLSRLPTGSDELAELEVFVTAMTTPTRPPRDVKHMATTLAATARSASRTQIRRALSRTVVLGASVAMVVAFSGLALAANGAAPGDLLYGLDRALERVGIGAGGPDERIAEFQTLVERGDEKAAIAFFEDEIEESVVSSTDRVTEDADDAAGPDADDSDTRVSPPTTNPVHEPATPGEGRSVPPGDGQGDERESGADDPTGPETTPPGQEQTPPGQEQTPPGREQTPPGQTNTPPGQEQTPPGQEQTPPGQEQTPPGREQAPGQTNTPPGQEQTPPGQEQTPPGQEQTPPGQTNTPPGQEKTPPGQSSSQGSNGSQGATGNNGNPDPGTPRGQGSGQGEG